MLRIYETLVLFAFLVIFWQASFLCLVVTLWLHKSINDLFIGFERHIFTCVYITWLKQWFSINWLVKFAGDASIKLWSLTVIAEHELLLLFLALLVKQDAIDTLIDAISIVIHGIPNSIEAIVKPIFWLISWVIFFNMFDRSLSDCCLPHLLLHLLLAAQIWRVISLYEGILRSWWYFLLREFRVSWANLGYIIFIILVALIHLLRVICGSSSCNFSLLLNISTLI